MDTACSSSLVAAHLAAAGLTAGESTAALAAGVNLILVPQVCCRVFSEPHASPTDSMLVKTAKLFQHCQTPMLVAAGTGAFASHSLRVDLLLTYTIKVDLDSIQAVYVLDPR